MTPSVDDRMTEIYDFVDEVLKQHPPLAHLKREHPMMRLADALPLIRASSRDTCKIGHEASDRKP